MLRGTMAVLIAMGGAAMAQDGELLQNAGFVGVDEDGVPRGWEMHTGNPLTAPQYAVVGREGTRWLRFEMRDNGASMGYVSQEVTLPEGAEALRVRVSVRCTGAALPEAHAFARIFWDAEPRQHVGTSWIYRYFPQWTRIEGRGAELDLTLARPEGANRARLDLMARWAPGGTVTFARPSLMAAPAPERRIVRLATVQGHAPAGSTREDAIEWAVSKVREAGEMDADLVCLGEAINWAGVSGVSALEACEPIPDGPMSRALMEAADRYNLIVCAGIYEQAGDIAYNTSALFGRRGELIGIYRKVHLPSPEVEWGFTPGDSYPVFDTEIGRIGMQICYDNAFPEGARALALNGAEIICLPIWGEGRSGDTVWPCSPRMLALNNGVAYVAAVYSQRESCVIDPYGFVLVSAGGEEGVYAADVDLTPGADASNWREDGSIMPHDFRRVWRSERMPDTYGPLMGW